MEKMRKVLEGNVLKNIKDFVLEVGLRYILMFFSLLFFAAMATLNLQSTRGIVFYIFLALVVAYLFTDALPPQKLHQRGVIGTTLCATAIGLVLGFALAGPLDAEELLSSIIICAFVGSTSYSLFSFGNDMPASGRASFAHYMGYALFSLGFIWALLFIWLLSSLLNDGFAWPLMTADDYLSILKMSSAIGIIWFLGVLFFSAIDAIKEKRAKKSD